MKVIAVDYGTRRTGIAIADTVTRLALPFEMFEGLADPSLAAAIADLCRQEAVDQIVVGVPWNADGSISQQSKITERFILTLSQHTKLPIARIDEHLTSHDAEGKLAGHFTRLQKRQRVDAIAAARILQDWLDQNTTRDA